MTSGGRDLTTSGSVAVGFLYHAASGKVLLHLRGNDAPPNAGKWAFFGGTVSRRTVVIC